MSRVFGLFLVVGVLCASTAIQAQVLAPPISFDCDVQAGRLSEWSSRITSREVHVRGTIEFVEMRDDNRWRPIASVTLSGETEDARAGLQLYLKRDETSNIAAAIVNPKDPKGRTDFASYPWKGNVIKFSLSLNSSGEIKVTVGDASAALGIGDLELNKLSLSCSTAEARFDDILVKKDGNT